MNHNYYKNKMSLKDKMEIVSFAKSIVDPKDDWAELFFPDSNTPIIINPDVMLKDKENKWIGTLKWKMKNKSPRHAEGSLKN